MAKSRRRTRKKKVGKSIRNMWRGLIAVILMAGCGYLASHLSGQETNEQVLSAHSGTMEIFSKSKQGTEHLRCSKVTVGWICHSTRNAIYPTGFHGN